MEDTIIERKNRGQNFVEYALARMKADSAFGAALRRADNPATESQAWEYIASWCDLDKDWDRIPFTTVAAAIARAKPEMDGTSGIGKAIAKCYGDGNKSDAAKSRLRRLLACSSMKEVCVILRPLLSLVASHPESRLCYARILNDLLYFGDGEKAKRKWAVDFYGRRENDSLST